MSCKDRLLHVAIQDAMGWLDYHLHLFHVRNPETGEPESIGIPDDQPYLDEPPFLAGWDVPISRYFVKEGDAASYEYDFGDDWRHTVALEGVDTIRKGERRLSCLEYPCAVFQPGEGRGFVTSAMSWRSGLEWHAEYHDDFGNWAIEQVEARYGVAPSLLQQSRQNCSLEDGNGINARCCRK